MRQYHLSPGRWVFLILWISFAISIAFPSSLPALTIQQEREIGEKVLEEVLRILKPKGSLIVVFPNDVMFFLARLLFLKFKEAFNDPGHVQQFRPKRMEALLKAKGFRVDRLMHLPFFVWPISLYHLIQVRKEPGEVAKPKRSGG